MCYTYVRYPGTGRIDVVQKERTMVRVIIEHQVKNAKDVARVLDIIRELRNEAMKRQGYITGETLVNTENTRNILVISTWHDLKHWQEWDTSETRLEITKRINPLLAKPYTVGTYQYYLVREKRVWSTL
jgi:quinol monooxygenase YgiN